MADVTSDALLQPRLSFLHLRKAQLIYKQQGKEL